jgi:hypothetical protein
VTPEEKYSHEQSLESSSAED